MEELGVNMASLTGAAAQMQQEGRTVSWLADVTDAPEVMGLLAFGDTVKPSSQKAIAQLHALGIQTVLVTGDNKGSASAVASALGIDQGQGPGSANWLAAVLIVLDERLADAVRFLCLLLGHGAGKEILPQVADAPECLGVVLTVVADRRQIGQADGKSI